MKRRTKQWLLTAAESVFWIAVMGLAVYLLGSEWMSAETGMPLRFGVDAWHKIPE